MSMNTPTYGVTPPISLANPTPKDNELNDLLIKELKLRGSFESEAATRKRVKVLNTLQKLTETFVYNVSRSKNMSEAMARDAGGKLFTFGSYRLGVYGPSSDIDALVVFPRYITREDFFTEFEKLLRERPELEEINSVREAFVPIIKLEFDGISIDLIFAKLDIPRIPKDLTLTDKNLLKNIDEKDLRALNGTRVTDEILNLVPKPTVFKHALRFIKMWAQQRAIYANVYGFPGGVAWAMLVARICQLYPNAVSSYIVEKFFQIYSQWSWPQPVLLKQIEDGPLQVRVWNPKLYSLDRQHRMPVITPAYPSMCATHNITASTQKIILDEFQRGTTIMHGILDGTKNWLDLLQRHDFFHRYKFYLCVVAATKSTYEEHLKYSGMFESKLRLLVQKLEMVPGVELAHPYVKSFENGYYCDSEDQVLNLINTYGTLKGEELASLLKSSKEKSENSNDTTNQQDNSASTNINGDNENLNQGNTNSDTTNDAKIEVNLTKLYIGLKLSLQKEGEKTLDIQHPCAEFFNICKSWPEYEVGKHFVQIKNVKLYDLLNDVYVEGETRPKKTVKRKRLVAKDDSKKKAKSVEANGTA